MKSWDTLVQIFLLEREKQETKRKDKNWIYFAKLHILLLEELGCK